MQVSSINSGNFCPKFQLKKQTNNTSPMQKQNLSRGEKITVCAISAATIGLGLAAIVLMKKDSSMPKTFFKKQKFLFNKKIQNAKNKPDPIIKMLKGKRDANALNDYKVYILKQKINSLNQKVLNNEINMNNPKIFEHLVRNKVKMEQEITNLLT